MKIEFSKYQGTGNDFVIIDNRSGFFPKENVELINRLCDRRFGIGADGLILLENVEGYDFRMIYYNADGSESSMCGNGGRCMTAFANKIGIKKDSYYFLAIDGPHESNIQDNGWVELKMSDVKNIEIGEDYFLLDTGSPHYVIFVEDIDDIDVVENGQAIRYSKRFHKEGVNVDFVEKLKKHSPTESSKILVATYERGVENETLSCGTGVTAAAIAYHLQNGNNEKQNIHINSKGGDLSVRLEKKGKEEFQNIWLCGPATLVFDGEISN